jgi:hypothetical protein
MIRVPGRRLHIAGRFKDSRNEPASASGYILA